jgi:hypothetical protein
VVLVCEQEEPLGKVAASILRFDETGEHGVRGDLHGKMHHAIKDIPQRAV